MLSVGFKLLIFILLLYFSTSRTFADSPKYVIVGDSILSGQVPDLDPKKEFNVGKWLDCLTTVKWEDRSLGGQTTNEIEKDVIKVYQKEIPDVIVANGGLNDIAGSQKKEVFLSNWKTILDLTKLHKTRLIIILMTPWRNEAYQDAYNLMIKRDDFNKSLGILAKSYSNVTVIDSDSTLGQFRPSGTPGNRWDIKKEYSFWGTHLTSKGSFVLANLIADKFFNSKKGELKNNCTYKKTGRCYLCEKITSIVNELGFKVNSTSTNNFCGVACDNSILRYIFSDY